MDIRQQTQNVAAQGRYGDSMLLHVNPAEVQGLASVMPLTKNPETGQPEAFLPFLAPLLGSMAGTALFTGLSPAVAGALGSGIATAIQTGDLKEGIISGITGFGLGKAFGAAGIGAEGRALEAGSAANAAADAANLATGEGVKQALAAEAASNTAQTAAQTAAEQTLGQGASAFADAISKPGAYLPIVAGEGTLETQRQQEAFEKAMREYELGQKQREEEMYAMYPEQIPMSSPYAYMAEGGEIPMPENVKGGIGNVSFLPGKGRLRRPFMPPRQLVIPDPNSFEAAMSGQLDRTYKEPQQISRPVTAEAVPITDPTTGMPMVYPEGSEFAGQPIPSGQFKPSDNYRPGIDPEFNYLPGGNRPASFLGNYLGQTGADLGGVNPYVAGDVLEAYGYGLPYDMMNPYGNPYGNPFDIGIGNPFGNPYGNPFGNPYGNPFGNPYDNPFEKPYEEYPPMDPVIPFGAEMDFMNFSNLPNLGANLGTYTGNPFGQNDFTTSQFMRDDFMMPPLRDMDFTNIGDAYGLGNLTNPNSEVTNFPMPNPNLKGLPDNLEDLANQGYFGTPKIDNDRISDNQLTDIKGPMINTTVGPNNIPPAGRGDYEPIDDFRPVTDMLARLPVTDMLARPKFDRQPIRRPAISGLENRDLMDIDSLITPIEQSQIQASLLPNDLARQAAMDNLVNADDLNASMRPILQQPQPPQTGGIPVTGGGPIGSGILPEANLPSGPTAPTAPASGARQIPSGPAMGGITAIPTPIQNPFMQLPTPPMRDDFMSIDRFNPIAMPFGMEEGRQIPDDAKGLQALAKTEKGKDAVREMGYKLQAGGLTPSPEELQEVQMAILGQMPNNQQVIDMFVEKYGNEIFVMIREQILNPEGNRQTQGMIEGMGGGMDDQVLGMIGSQQAVAVSPGEYIVPADVVSGLGDGSSDAGAKELDGLLDRVRQERTNTTKQPKELNKGKVLPK